MSGGVRQNADKCEERFPDMQLFIKLELTRPVKTSELNGADSRVQGLGRAYQGTEVEIEMGQLKIAQR